MAAFQLDRVEPAIFAKPTNYGFIPQTLDEDGDELDVLLITEQPLPTGIFLEAKVIGVMKFVDDGEVDDKIVCVSHDLTDLLVNHQTAQMIARRRSRAIVTGVIAYGLGYVQYRRLGDSGGHAAIAVQVTLRTAQYQIDR